MASKLFELPDLICLSDFGGSFDVYLDAVYKIFERDFITSKPTFKGTRLGLKRHPVTDGRAYTFYHMTHEGKDELNRTPDLRRCERIGWPRPMIDFSESSQLKVWSNVRGRDKRILIYHQAEKYLVILDDRGDFILPWTAYLITYRHQEEKLLKEYEAYKKAEAAK
ncbi:hypothetical protein [Adhaeribacter aquaticus]|uniref:hypothetical protein n=1 Tax=Adhaeribacter aquaticus TaxID=299567 RepID=UPI000416868B|nr:hypothetical protein [Adhaeribacter aquaticus]